MTEPNPLAAANRTGYLLQAALETRVCAGKEEHGFSVLDHELPWRDPVSGEIRFLDLLLRGVGTYPLGFDAKALRLVVECKRIDGYWTFPVPITAPPHHGEVRLLASGVGESTAPQWRPWVFGPEDLYHSEYCALTKGAAQGGGQHDGRLLEPWATELVTACQVIAGQATPISAPQGRISGTVYVPVIATTASLHVLRYDPATVSLENGQMSAPPKDHVFPVPWVVLSKKLGFEPSCIDPPLRGIFGRWPHEDVFIVNAAHFDSFLRTCGGIQDGRS